MLLQQQSGIAIVIYPFSFNDGQLFTNSLSYYQDH